jgi:hypothetical protein
VYGAVVGLHRFLGIDPNDPATTWPSGPFAPPANRAHEGSANSRWHMALLIPAAAWALAWRKRERAWLLLPTSLLAGFLLFCFYLKWEHDGARFLLPLFILASPLAGAFLASLRPAVLTAAVCLFLLSGARLPALKNWARPLAGPGSVWTSPRDENYFADLTVLDVRDAYVRAVDLAAGSGCPTVGIDAVNDQAEYPFQALLLRRRSAVRFLHVGVRNASARYAPRDAQRPCAVLCLSCASQPANAARYAEIGPPVSLGGFVLFLPGR